MRMEGDEGQLPGAWDGVAAESRLWRAGRQALSCAVASGSAPPFWQHVGRPSNAGGGGNLRARRRSHPARPPSLPRRTARCATRLGLKEKRTGAVDDGSNRQK